MTFTTANQLVIPTGVPVRIELTSADVIHAFWVPKLGRKMDMIPGAHQRDLARGRRCRAPIAASAPNSAGSSTPTWRSTCTRVAAGATSTRWCDRRSCTPRDAVTAGDRAAAASVHACSCAACHTRPRHRGRRHLWPRPDPFRQPRRPSPPGCCPTRRRISTAGSPIPRRQARRADAAAARSDERRSRRGRDAISRALQDGAGRADRATPPIAQSAGRSPRRLRCEIWETAPGLKGWFGTVDHKVIGIRYLFTAFAFLLIGGVEALVMRVQLAQPDASAADARSSTTSCSRCTA